MSDETITVQAPVCIHLRTKKMYYQEGYDGVDLATDSHPYYWCVQTMDQTGPDDGMVAARHCRLGRTCFEGVD
jgi:hypothetical protein